MGASNYKYCKPWEICWDSAFDYHCQAIDSESTCYSYEQKASCDLADGCEWVYRPQKEHLSDLESSTAWSTHLSHCKYNYGHCRGSIPTYYCEDGATICNDPTNYNFPDDNCVGIGTGFCEVIVYDISEWDEETLASSDCLSHENKTNATYQTTIDNGNPALFACTDASALNYICASNALAEHYHNFSPFIDNNLDPQIWGMYCDGVLNEEGSCMGTIRTSYCESVCHIIDDSARINGCLDNNNEFVPQFSTPYHCTLFGYNWISNSDLLGITEQACCEEQNSGYWDGNNCYTDGGMTEEIRPYDRYGVPNNLIFSNYRGDHLKTKGQETDIQLNWDFVAPTGIPQGYQSDKCQYECGGPWNKQCDDPVWYECRYIEGIGNRCVGKIDIEDFELTIDEDQ